MSYDPQSISAYFDQYGQREWDRLVANPVDEISLHIHTHYLHHYIEKGNRVLEIGAGAGRFTQVLAETGARIVVADISSGQVALNRQFAAQLGFAQAVEDWQVVDICDLSRYPDSSFDRVVAYGGPFSYVLEKRGQALAECLRVLRPGGLLLASVMLVWGSAHRALPGVLDLPPAVNQRITASGDLTPATIPERQGNFMHLFRSQEVREWLASYQVSVRTLSASGVLAAAWDAALPAIRSNAEKWAELLRMEVEASAEPGCLDLGTHLIFIAEKPA